jgi:hypothetical protein
MNGLECNNVIDGFVIIPPVKLNTSVGKILLLLISFEYEQILLLNTYNLLDDFVKICFFGKIIDCTLKKFINKNKK